MSQDNINSETNITLTRFNDFVSRYADRVAYSFRYLHKIVHDPNCDERLKQECLKRAIDKVVWYNTHCCAMELLYHLSYEFDNDIEDQSDFSLSIIELLRQIMNHPAVVESYIKPYIYHKSHRFVVKSAYAVDQLFRDETALQVLRSTSNRKLFIVFGYHPVMVKHVNLQVKWIKYYSKYEKIIPNFGISNLTDEALLSVPVDDAFRFIYKAMSQSYISFAENMRHFTTETIRKIVYMHILAHGKHEDAEEVLRAIDYIEDYR